MGDSRIQAVEHVHMEARPELAEDLRWFYGILGTLPETRDSGVEGVLRFRSAQIELRIRLLPDAPEVDPVPARLTLAVPSLEEARRELEERHWPFEEEKGLSYTERRLIALDPMGHRITFKREWRYGPF
jgi:hypothetical protein